MSERALPPHALAGEPPARHERLPEAMVDAAIAWAVKLDYGEATPHARQAFERWLQADPRHALAWQRVGSLKGGFGELPARLALDTLAETDARLARAGRRRAMKLLSMAGVALATGWVAREHAPWQRLLADASTGVGQQQMLHLADGSVVVLNTDSAVSADLDGDTRVLRLRRGEILVTTGADSQAIAQQGRKRPFWVDTPFGRLQALGTRFVVRLDDTRARVTVQEGAVELTPRHGGERHVIQAGEGRWLDEDGSGPLADSGLQADSWSDGVIAARDARLDELLAELSRHRRGRIACDEAVAGLRVTGYFQLRDTDQTLQFLARTQPVRIGFHTRWWVTVGPQK